MVLPYVCGVLSYFALVHLCACLVGGAVCAVSLASCCLFTGVQALCVVYVVSLGICRMFTVAPAWCLVGAVSLVTLRLFTSVHAWSVVCLVSLASWRLFTGLHARFVCVCGLLDHLALVHRKKRLVCWV